MSKPILVVRYPSIQFQKHNKESLNITRETLKNDYFVIDVVDNNSDGNINFEVLNGNETNNLDVSKDKPFPFPYAKAVLLKETVKGDL